MITCGITPRSCIKQYKAEYNGLAPAIISSPKNDQRTSREVQEDLKMSHAEHKRHERTSPWGGYEVSYILGDEAKGDEIKEVKRCRLILGTAAQVEEVILTLDLGTNLTTWIDDDQLPKGGDIYYRFVCDVIFENQPQGHSGPHNVETTLTEVKPY